MKNRAFHLSQRRSVFGQHLNFTVDHIALRMFPEGLVKALQTLSKEEVITIEKEQEGAGGFFDGRVAGCRYTLTLFMEEEAYPGLIQCPKRFNGSVGGGIIHNDAFPVAITLLLETAYGMSNNRLQVSRRRDDGKKGFVVRVCHGRSSSVFNQELPS